MSESNPRNRKEQARLQVGRTQVTAPVAGALLALFLLIVAGPPVAEIGADLLEGRRPLSAPAAIGELAGAVRGSSSELVAGRFRAANSRMLTAIQDAEATIEEDSLIRRTLRAPVQRVLTSVFGVGNEQTYVGREGWLFFRPDFDYSTRRGFREAAELARRRQDVDSPMPAEPDPLPALLGFAEQLDARGVRLLVLPVPGKTVIHPQPLVPLGRVVEPPLHNPSFEGLVDRLRAAAVEVYDPTAGLLALEASGTPAFLRADSHWSPQAVESTAAAVARRLDELGAFDGLGERGSQELFRRPVALSGQGDLVAMLRLAQPDRLFARERIEVRRVLRADGGSWRPRRGSPVLLLGDSFSNVFSDPALGWGSAAGLAEQLAFELGRPVDRIARNAGGAYEARAELARELASGRDRLAGTRVVVYEFATRELLSGDWRLLDLD